MPITLPYLGKAPRLAASAWLAEGTVVTGDVEIGEESSIWFGTVIRGDVNSVRIGARTNVQDQCTVHVTGGTHPTVIGDEVTVGHRAVLHGCTVLDRCLIGIGAIVLDGAVVGPDAMVGAGALVPPRMIVPQTGPRPVYKAPIRPAPTPAASAPPRPAPGRPVPGQPIFQRPRPFTPGGPRPRAARTPPLAGCSPKAWKACCLTLRHNCNRRRLACVRRLRFRVHESTHSRVHDEEQPCPCPKATRSLR